MDLVIQAADVIILKASDGSLEETELLTARVAQRFMEKVCFAAETRHSRMLFFKETGK